ncbi:hypothetical protein ACT453_58455, partial [Bacillus sp. D-CC]
MNEKGQSSVDIDRINYHIVNVEKIYFRCYAASLRIAVALFLSMAPFFQEWSQFYSPRSGNRKLI